MNSRTALAWNLLFAIGAAAYSAYLYNILPDQIPSHWNINGEPDKWGPKGITLFMIPAIIAFMALLMPALPYMSPEKFKIDSFRGTYNSIMTMVSLMLTTMHVIIMQNTLHPQMNATKAIFGSMMVFVGLIGNLLGKIKPNFYMGIRTPWTLASEKVWVATHRLAARSMFGAGLIGAILVFMGVPIMPVFILFMISVLYPVVYSFLLYKKLERNHAI